MFSVRQAAEDDWQAIGALFVAAGRAAWTHIMTPESLETFAPPAAWLELIRAGQGLVVCVQDHPVGFSALRASQDDDAAPKTGEIASFYTHPDVWGQGAGRLLMQESLLQLSRMGFSDATLWTEERNY
ncbi:MAG TPA: GNAT family N-acetyltransferase, partial [Fimbriimonadaceae bacterium]|nr:GNAT family N-acetyltransferase [Fimbriimonadaceae bacterium]